MTRLILFTKWQMPLFFYIEYVAEQSRPVGIISDHENRFTRDSDFLCCKGNLSSKSLTRSDTNKPVHPQKGATLWKFWIIETR